MAEGNRTILVVEDDELNQKLIRAILSRAGYGVVAALTAEAGVELAKSRRPDLVLMDIRLPGMGGLEAVRILRQDALTQGIPVVAVSAYAMAEDRLRAAEAGCVDYVTKPFDLKTFMETVSRLCPRSH